MITSAWFAPVMWSVFIAVVLWFISVVGPFFFGAPWVPMPVARARRMLALAEVQPGETVYDLGSGDGRVLVVAAREFGAEAVGVEIEPFRALHSQATLAVQGLGHHTRVIRANFLDVDLSQADVVTLYLLPKAMTRLAPKLRRELKSGARVVTLVYHLPNWEPLRVEGDIRVYRLTAPAKVQ